MSWTVVGRGDEGMSKVSWADYVSTRTGSRAEIEVGVGQIASGGDAK